MMITRRAFLAQTALTASAIALNPINTYASLNKTKRRTNAMPDYLPTRVKLLTQTTPKQDGFYFPGEWSPHEYTIMALPTAQNWVEYGLKNARREWAGIANILSEFEPVLMVVHPDDSKMARKLFSSDVEIVEIPVNDGWSRDSGPMFLIDGRGSRRVAGFTFNGWGAKFPPYDDDALLKARLCKHLRVAMYPADLVLEGGGIVLDGEGTVITTEQCLLHPNRNPGITKKQVEAFFDDYLGADRTIWLDKGLTPDPVTDGHADGICAYVAPGVVLLHTTDDRGDPNYTICNDAKQRLTDATDAKGRKLEIIEIPLGNDAGHIGFYIANGCVLVPTTGDPKQDDAPMAILKDVFPERKVIGVSAGTIVRGGGSIHCITQQVPNV